MLVVSDTVDPIIGYQITEQIYSGSKTLVYRGIRQQDQTSVILKLMRNEYPSFAEIAQFRNQYTITKNLNLPGIIKPYSLENHRNGCVLVMEDFGGLSLKDWLRQRGVGANLISLNQFFHIAIEIASILEGLHHHRIIHKDIKPANILIHPTKGEIRLIDFSIATLLPKEIQSLTNPNILEGTLAYISPEQTGRMNRGIDYRTDFYSLGVTFFELLTGQLPFSSNEAMELVYCHIAKEPPKASHINSDIPPILSDIISKLMAKNAEDRYQSAYGLKHDLEVCRNQWQEHKNIAPFELGNRDISNHFVIPEKLYGRQREVETILAAFERVSGQEQLTTSKSEMILVAGFSGVGKTAVVREVHKPIARQRSYFIAGKFDQFQRDIPLSGLVQAFRDLIGQLLSESDTQIQQWKAKILAVLGTQAQIIIDVIPELEKIIGQQPPVEEISGNAAQNRFNLLLQRFIQIFTTKERPLVIFLDDLQWADMASLKFVQLLMNEAASCSFGSDGQEIVRNQGSLLLIGAYRDNEVSHTHPLTLTLNEISQTGANIQTINLLPLSQGDLNHLIADTLHCRDLAAFPLTQMVFAKTKGNPFFVTQFLKSLYAQEIIVLNFDVGYWQYELEKLQELSLTDDVVEFMATQIARLPKNAQTVLKLAACIGNAFDLKTLAIAQEKSLVDTASDLWTALIEGLVIPQNETYSFFADADSQQLILTQETSTTLSLSNYQVPKYKFVHDRVQQAAYSLIPAADKKSIHLKIGLLLFNNIPIGEREEKIFELVNQFNIAIELITNQEQRDHLAAMNLTAGCKALASTAYAAAIKYLNTGIELLADNYCWDTQYELTLALYETAAEVAYLNGDFEQAEQFVQVVLAHAKTCLEKVKVFEVTIQAYGAQNKALEAVKAAISFLKFLGVELPEYPNQADVQREMEATTANLAHKNLEDLVNLPEMTAAEPLAVMRILSSVIALAYHAVPELFPLIVLKQINLSVEYGNCSFSTFAYVCYGLMLCGVVKDIEVGYKFGKLAENLLTTYKVQEAKAKSLETYNSHIRHWKEHIRETTKPLLEAYAAGIETGDLEFAAYSLLSYVYASYFLGKELTALKQEMAIYNNAIYQIKQKRVFYWTEIFRQLVLNLLTVNEHPCRLVGEAYDEEKMLPLHLETNDVCGLLYIHFCKLQLCYLFGDYSQAVENAIKSEKYLEGGIGKTILPNLYCYDSLARLAVYSNVGVFEQQQILQKVTANQEQIQHWAAHAPMNYLHKFYLVEAERYRVLGKYLEAIDNYDRAIFLAKENEFIHEEALANELAAKFYLMWGKDKIAQAYLTDAYHNYIRWGALAKIEDLQKHYPQLLNSINQSEKIIYPSVENSNPHLNIISSTFSDHETLFSSNTTISDMLDLASVIKAAQAISGEIELEALLSKLMTVVMENAGASKCVLILSKGDNLELTITAISHSSTFNPNQTEFQSIPLESSFDVPITLVNYVKRTQEILVMDDTKSQTAFAADIYMLREEPKSLLCIPMINQSKLLGILYLENKLTPGAFTRDRLEVIKLLITQATISLENAILYRNLAQANERLEEYNHTLEEKVAIRTAELEEKNQSLQQTLQELQRTQTQLIQSEKMSSLGQMVAGIAHEINNPINFIHGNIDHASEYVQGLLHLIAVYQQEYPQPSDVIEEKAEEIDLEFLAEDLPKILESMKVGSSRIRNIVLSLRNFSRLDESEMKPVDIHDGINNTLMILHHRLKENNTRRAIKVIKEYTQLPQINCYAGQLNQVFMNILSNAIDALEESIAKGTITDQPTITIRTELINLYIVRIRIADNGTGINAKVKQNIFNPFFTTKPVGSGTGLGLSISYQIVVDKHKGQLICNSEFGQGAEFVIDIPMR